MSTVTIDSVTLDGLTVSIDVSYSGIVSGPGFLTLFTPASEAVRTVQVVTLPGTSGTVTVTDLEPGQNTDLTYFALLTDGVMTSADGPVTCPDQLDAGTDLIGSCIDPTLTASVSLSGALVQRHVADPKVLKVLGRAAPVVISGARRSWSAELQVVTETLEQAAALDTVLGDGSVICLRPRTPSAHGLKPVEYLLVGDVKKSRLTPLARIADRLYTLPSTKVTPPAFEGVAEGGGSGTCTFPGASTFPGALYPGCVSSGSGTYPSTSTYPSASTYPGTTASGVGAYPGSGTYPDSDTYPGGPS
jgi:hypothetical protein